jgi:hypothetical protein
VAAKYLEEAGSGVYHFRQQWASEAAIAAIAPRPDSPDWLVSKPACLGMGSLLLHFLCWSAIT